MKLEDKLEISPQLWV